MSYNEFQPSIASQAVKCFWTLEEDQAVYNSEEILPDSYVELVVNFGAPLVLETESGAQVETPPIFLKGLTKKPLRLRVTGVAQLVGVRLYPWTLAGLLGVRLVQANGVILSLNGVMDDLVPVLAVSVQRNDFTETVACLQEIVTLSTGRKPPNLAPIKVAIELLYATHGTIRMSELATRTYLSSSQLERQFKYITGVTPKTLARLIRFETVRNQLVVDPLASLSDLAYSLDYTDQAHLTHDFKALADRTPGDFAASVAQRPYADFLQYT